MKTRDEIESRIEELRFRATMLGLLDLFFHGPDWEASDNERYSGYVGNDAAGVWVRVDLEDWTSGHLNPPDPVEIPNMTFAACFQGIESFLNAEATEDWSCSQGDIPDVVPAFASEIASRAEELLPTASSPDVREGLRQVKGCFRKLDTGA